MVCVNVALLTAIIWFAGAPAAQAQVIGVNDYVVITGNVGQHEEVVYVTDLAKRRTLPFYYDRDRGQLLPYKGVRLLRDFGRGEELP
jgi:hypothetical protein